MKRYLSTLALALAAAFLAPQVKAEKVVIYREGQIVNPLDVAAVLGKTRSIRLLDDAPAAPAAPATLATPAPRFAAVTAATLAKTSARTSSPAPVSREETPADAVALSLPVRFAFDSADILPAAQTQLDAVAEGIKLLAPDSIVTVEGHTDATGTEAYNLALSKSRARAVRDYLVRQHGIDAARLKTVGYGKDQPIEGSNPYAALNRRVQFRGT